jgi:hypothetical protein
MTNKVSDIQSLYTAYLAFNRRISGKSIPPDGVRSVLQDEELEAFRLLYFCTISVTPDFSELCVDNDVDRLRTTAESVLLALKNIGSLFSFCSLESKYGTDLRSVPYLLYELHGEHIFEDICSELESRYESICLLLRQKFSGLSPALHTGTRLSTHVLYPSDSQRNRIDSKLRDFPMATFASDGTGFEINFVWIFMFDSRAR